MRSDPAVFLILFLGYACLTISYSQFPDFPAASSQNMTIVLRMIIDLNLLVKKFTTLSNKELLSFKATLYSGLTADFLPRVSCR